MGLLFPKRLGGKRPVAPAHRGELELQRVGVDQRLECLGLGGARAHRPPSLSSVSYWESAGAWGPARVSRSGRP